MSSLIRTILLIIRRVMEISIGNIRTGLHWRKGMIAQFVMSIYPQLYITLGLFGLELWAVIET